MRRRRIGQESFGFGGDSKGRNSSLDNLMALIDWMPIDRDVAETPKQPRENKAGHRWPCGDVVGGVV